MAECKIDFRALTIQERISRLEQAVECLSREIALLKQMAGYGATVAQDVATEFRACDGEVLVHNKQRDYRMLLDEWFAVLQTSSKLVAFEDQTRLGEFGIDRNGQFFAFKNDLTNGEIMVLLATENGTWIRDQNGVWGKIVRNADGSLHFLPA